MSNVERILNAIQRALAAGADASNHASITAQVAALDQEIARLHREAARSASGGENEKAGCPVCEDTCEMPDTYQACEACALIFPIEAMHSNDEGCWFCPLCINKWNPETPGPQPVSTSARAAGEQDNTLSPEDRAQMFIGWCALSGFGLNGWPDGAYDQLVSHIRAGTP